MIDSTAIANTWYFRHTPVDHITLAALHGDKPDAIRRLIESIQRALEDSLGNQLFHRYQLPWVHATIIGLTADRHDGRLVQRCKKEYTQGPASQHEMDLDDVYQHLKQIDWNLEVRWGGFGAQDQKGYEEQFKYNGDGLFVLKGWPTDEGPGLAGSMYGIRNSFERYHVLHRYHVDPDSGRVEPKRKALPQNLWMDFLRHGSRVRWRGVKNAGKPDRKEIAVSIGAAGTRAANRCPK